MSTPSNSKVAAKPKPKRPLSGYNLFYRYKRNKILEATARPGHDNEAVIRAVLAAPPGLEGVPPASPLFRLPPTELGQWRVAAIRYAMEGKLFPNENARNRLHRKVLGMGFVEMGRMMRQAWGQADKLTKDLFGELADVGRVRYRRLVAEYKLSSNHPANVHVKTTPAKEPVKSSVVANVAQTQTSNKSGEAKAAAKFTATRATAAAAINPVKKKAVAALPATGVKTKATAKAAKPSLNPQQAPSSSDPMLEALSVWATKSGEAKRAAKSTATRAAAATAINPRKRKVMAALPAAPANTKAMAKAAKLSPIHQQAPSSSDPMLKALPVCVTKNSPPAATAQSAVLKPVRPSYGRRVSKESRDLFQSLSFNTMINPTTSANVPANTTEKTGYGRRVSTELDLCGDSLFEPLPVETSDASATHEISNRPKWGRRVSTDQCPMLPTHGSMGGTATHNSNVNSGSNTNPEGLRTNLELQEMRLRNALKQIQYQIAENNSVLSREMQVCAQHNVSGEAYRNIKTSSRPFLPDGGIVGSDKPGEGVSTQDFMDFIGKLDDAIDDHSVDVDAIETTEDLANGLTDSIRSIDIDLASSSIEAVASTDGDLDGVEDGCPTYIFGKPMFDMAISDSGVKPVSPSQMSIPMPSAVELKTSGARMA